MLGLLTLHFLFLVLQLLVKKCIIKKKEDKVPDWCPRATYESARWSNFWFKRKFLFYAFKYRWSHIRKTLQNRKKALQLTGKVCSQDHLGSYENLIITGKLEKRSQCGQMNPYSLKQTVGLEGVATRQLFLPRSQIPTGTLNLISFAL